MPILRTSLFIALIVLLIMISTHIIYQINIETSYFKNVYIYIFDRIYKFTIIICIKLFYCKLKKIHCFFSIYNHQFVDNS